MAVAGQLKLLVPMAGLIDKDAELARLDKQIIKLEKELSGAQARLTNPSFVEKAPAAVVEKARQQADAQAQTLVELKAQQDKIRAL